MIVCCLLICSEVLLFMWSVVAYISFMTVLGHSLMDIGVADVIKDAGRVWEDERTICYEW